MPVTHEVAGSSPVVPASFFSLKAFGQIPKSPFILRLIDDPALRQAIEKQMVGIEHAHRFMRAVSLDNPREFMQAEKQDQKMAEARKRLIKNCIICWKKPRMRQAERRLSTLWPTSRRFSDSTSTCSVSMISPKKSCRIWSESHLQNSG
ncbi:MAG: Tn3 family transposase [Terriglobia bacterium]